MITKKSISLTVAGVILTLFVSVNVVDEKIEPANTLETTKREIVIDKTDKLDHSKEKFIIKSDKESYISGLSGADVYFSVTNIGKAESGKVNIKGASHRTIYAYDKAEKSKTVPTYKEGKEIPCTSTLVDTKDKTKEKCYEQVQDGYDFVTWYEDNWIPVGEDHIFPEGTTFLKTYIQYAQGFPGEFDIEVVGDFGGYGLLDPNFGAGWNRKVAITIDNTKVSGSGDLTDFPVLLTVDNFPSEMFDADGSYSAKSDGCDVRFSSDEDGAIELPIEVVEFTTDNDPANGSAEIYVKIPTLDYNDDTVIYAWYNNASASCYAVDDTYGSENVWDSNYLMVHHLRGAAYTDLDDSTSNDNDFTAEGGSPDYNQAGKLGTSAVNFTAGSSEYLDWAFSGFGSFVSNSNFTNEVWINPDLDNVRMSYFCDYNSAGSAVSMCMEGGGYTLANGYWNALTFDSSVKQMQSGYAYSTGTWYNVVFSFNDSTNRRDIYVQGTSQVNNTLQTGALANGVNTSLGRAGDYAAALYFDGKIDELRVSGSARSADWIATGYNNQSAPDTFASAGTPESTALFNDWGRKVEITIAAAEVDSDLTDYPFLMTIANLPSEMFDADGLYPALSGGGDIRVTTDSAGTNRLPLEVVAFTIDNDPANGTAELYTKVPSVSSSVDTSIWVWYNKAAETQPAADSTYGSQNVWDSGYAAVYHMGDATTSSISDSTSSGYTGTKGAANQPLEATGKIGSAQDFTGGNYKINIGDVSEIDSSSYITLENWAYRSGGTDFDAMISKGTSGAADTVFNLSGTLAGVDDFLLRVSNGANKYSYSTGNIFTTGAWDYAVLVFDGTQAVNADRLKLYFNDTVPALTTTGSLPATSANTGVAYIGVYNDIYYYWNGYIDEVRISNVARTADWLTACYSNQNTPGTFAAAGTPETPGGTAAPTITGISTCTGISTITF